MKLTKVVFRGTTQDTGDAGLLLRVWFYLGQENVHYLGNGGYYSWSKPGSGFGGDLATVREGDTLLLWDVEIETQERFLEVDRVIVGAYDVDFSQEAVELTFADGTMATIPLQIVHDEWQDVEWVAAAPAEEAPAILAEPAPPGGLPPWLPLAVLGFLALSAMGKRRGK